MSFTITFFSAVDNLRIVEYLYIYEIVGMAIHVNNIFTSLSNLSICTGVVVTVAFQQVDGSPDAETGTQCDDEGLKNGDCAVEKCHKCVPPCTLRPYGLMNNKCPSACAPAKGQKNSQVSNFNQKPGYLKRAAHRRPHR